MNKKKILYIAQEISPYVEENVSDQSKVLPLGMLARGHDIRTFMPNYGTINQLRNHLHQVIRHSDVNLTVNDKGHQQVVKVASLLPQRMQVYFIDNDDFFSRKGTVTDKEGNFYEDNCERSAFFIRGVFETVKKLRWVPDIIHCQGWFSGLAPLYLSTLYKDDPALSGAKVVFSIYDMTPETPFGQDLTQVLGYDEIKHELLDGSALKRDDLYKLILSYVDGLLFATSDVSDETRESAAKLDLPVMDYDNTEEAIEAVDAFYDQLLGKK